MKSLKVALVAVCLAASTALGGLFGLGGGLRPVGVALENGANINISPSGDGSKLMVSVTGVLLPIHTNSWEVSHDGPLWVSYGPEVWQAWDVGKGGTSSNAIELIGYTVINATNSSWDVAAYSSDGVVIQSRYYHAFLPAPRGLGKIVGPTKITKRMNGLLVATNYFDLQFYDGILSASSNNITITDVNDIDMYVTDNIPTNHYPSKWYLTNVTRIFGTQTNFGLSVRADMRVWFGHKIALPRFQVQWN